MGTKRPDQIAADHWRGSAETVGEMLSRGWDLIAVCRHCTLQMVVDLRVVALVKGAGFSLWNRHGRCRRLGCPGVVDFRFRAPGMTQHRPLSAPDRLPDPRTGHVERAFAEERERQRAAARRRQDGNSAGGEP